MILGSDRISPPSATRESLRRKPQRLLSARVLHPAIAATMKTGQRTLRLTDCRQSPLCRNTAIATRPPFGQHRSKSRKRRENETSGRSEDRRLAELPPIARSRHSTSPRFLVQRIVSQVVCKSKVLDFEFEVVLRRKHHPKLKT